MASKVRTITKALIATDDERILQACRDLRIPVELTRQDHPTGCDRVAEVAERHDADIYVNVQGDEPMVDPKTVEKAIDALIGHRSINVVNCMSRIEHPEELVDHSVPKVVFNARQEAVFLSRCSVPYPKGRVDGYFKQVCIYAFRNSALSMFSRWDRGPLEGAEDIELLRFIENGYPVQMVEVSGGSISVDTPKDLDSVRAAFESRPEFGDLKGGEDNPESV